MHMKKKRVTIYESVIINCCLMILFFACGKDKAVAPTKVGGAIITSDCPDTIYYSIQIVSILNDNCVSCHSGSNTGFPPDLTNHSEVSSNASAVLSSIQSGYMPQGAPKLPDSIIKQFQCWINQGRVKN